MRFFRRGLEALLTLVLVCGLAQTVFASFTHDSIFIGTGLNTPQGIARTASGHLYIANAATSTNSKLLHYNASGTLVTTRVITNARPRAITVNPNNGHVYAVGSGNLLDYADFDNSPEYTIRATGLGTYSTVFTVQGMTLNADYSRLYVGNTGGSNIKVYNTSDWSLVETISLPSGSKIPGPGPMAFDSQGNLFVADYGSTNLANVVGNGRLLRYDHTSLTWTTFVSGLTDSLNANTADSPVAVTFDSLDNVIVVLRGSRAGGDGAIYKYTPDGSLISSFRTTNSTQVMNLPQGGVAVDLVRKFIYVSAATGNRIQRYSMGIDGPSAVSAYEDTASVQLSWTNTADPTFDSVTIRRSASSYPATVTDGTAVASGLTGTTFTDDTTGLTAGTVYYYSLFSKDSNGNYSDPTLISALVNRGVCSMKAYWKFDESVSAPIDSTGNGYTGTSTGAVSLSEYVPTTGFTNPYSFTFNGLGTASGSVTVTRPVEDDFSICAWINTTAPGAGFGSQHYETMAIAHAEAGGTANDFGFGVNGSGKLLFGDGRAGADYGVTGATSVNTGNVLGQADFVTATAVSNQAGLNAPSGVVVDEANNRAYVPQSTGNRVSIFDISTITDGEGAVDVLGQYDGVGSQGPAYLKSAANNGPNRTGLSGPQGLVLDTANNRLFVSDSANNRIFEYDLNSSHLPADFIADHMLGQPLYWLNAVATTQAGVSLPSGLAFDPTGNTLFAADFTNNRVLAYDVASITDGENAIAVLGQPTFLAATAGITQVGLSGPRQLMYDRTSGKLFVIDATSSRAVIYDVNHSGDNTTNKLFYFFGF